MVKFSQIASELNSERLDSLGNPRAAGFYTNEKGIMQKTQEVKVSVRSPNGIKPLGIGFICYSDQESTDNCPAAEMIRADRWKSHQVGKLWLYIRGQMKLLARIDPDRTTVLASGFMTETKQIIIDTDR